MFVSGGALLWHFCHQRTWWIIQMAEAATWMHELDLCMWRPECRLIAATWLLSHESTKIFLNVCIYLMQEWEDGLITLGDLGSKSAFKWLWLSKNVSSWGKIILIIAHLWAVVELFLKSYLTLCFYGGLNQIQSDICSYSPKMDHTTSCLPQFTRIKRLLFLCVR